MSCSTVINHCVSYSIRFIHMKHEQTQYFPFSQSIKSNSRPKVANGLWNLTANMHLSSASHQLICLFSLVILLCAFTSGGEYPSTIALHTTHKLTFTLNTSYIFLIILEKIFVSKYKTSCN